MGETIAIICEYNPFHNGHKYQIDKLREQFSDATIVAIMSGNVTQRGEFAIFDKYIRAKGAVLCGVNAVLEMPYPYSCASAEVFARAGVEIASKIGADYLCFGSESADIDNLREIASAIDSIDFEKKISMLLEDKLLSYSMAREKALEALGKKAPKNPNDILAVEYLRSINKIAPKIVPYPIQRVGEGYKSQRVGDFMSASAIRMNFYRGRELMSIPEPADEWFFDKNYLDLCKSESFLFRNVLRMEAEEIEQYYDVPKGCGFYISEIAKNAKGEEDFFESLNSKTYTRSRLKRIIMYLATNVKRIDGKPSFTTLLAADEKGRDFLKALRKKSQIVILTKHSDIKSLSEQEKALYYTSKKADELYYTLLREPLRASEAYKKSTIII